LLELGRGTDARAELQLSYDTFSKVQAKDSPSAVSALGWLARADVEAGDPKSGLAHANQALQYALANESLWNEGLARWHRARALVALHRKADAVAEANKAIEELAKQKVPDTNLLRAKVEAWLATI
jgi:hypothetical protein